jgi:hypothetical protein
MGTGQDDAWDMISVLTMTATSHHRLAAQLERLTVTSAGAQRANLIARAVAERGRGDDAAAAAHVARGQLHRGDVLPG